MNTAESASCFYCVGPVCMCAHCLRPVCRAHNLRVNEEVVVCFKSSSWFPRRASPRPVARQRRQAPGVPRPSATGTCVVRVASHAGLRPGDQVPFLYDFILL